MNRVRIEELKENEVCRISGFVEKLRDTRYMIFMIVKDITGKIQVSIDKELNADLVETSLTAIIGSSVSIEGKMVLNEKVKLGGKEFLPTKVVVESVAAPSPIDETSSLDQRLNYRWLDLRSDKNLLLMQVKSCFTNSFREFLDNNNFLEIQTPKLIGAESESGAGVFEVKYYDTKAFLCQSPQFYKQMAIASGLERVFEFGPCFRAEKFSTNRHSSEFTSLDLEFAHIENYEDVMSMEEDIIIHCLTKIKEKFGEKIKETFGVDVVIPTKPFPKMNLLDLYKIFEERYGYVVDDSEKTDMTTEAERLAYRYSMEEFGHEFMFVVGYPGAKRPFYHMRDENGNLLGYDLIWKGVEITSGAQREHRYDQLCKNAKEKGLGKDVEFYLEFFKYGCPPHGGFAIGLSRFSMLLLNIDTVKEVDFIFRGPNRLFP